MNKIVKYSITLASLAVLGGVSPLSTQLVGPETIVYANNPTQTETRKIGLVYKDSEKAEYIGEGSSIDLKPGETYTFTAPELAGYQFESLDYADASYWTEGVILNGTKEQHYRSNVGTLTLSYEDIAPVIEANRTHVPILYVNYKEVVATNPDNNGKTGETLPTDKGEMIPTNTSKSQISTSSKETTTEPSTSSQSTDTETSSATGSEMPAADDKTVNTGKAEKRNTETTGSETSIKTGTSSKKESTEKKTLPKTGQEYSYLPLLGITGLSLIASTYLLRRKSN
ncbi:TPA: LPXTG cell wall anchor domain-containing protein [Streptococcus suis]|nr:LPXTG cell wall anchor domain-containing protein [Streptococcus suis]HEP1790111.1 LPXTG cell wall anchor domain-containing protein [Streptococcus suis]HEP1825060.1 LPXTG cell wall anchor domain-containing protein [Streptococcus suis]HEP1841142.1 LPXTG cell wall anchor domain-containing protein [Streptococcus suis]